MSGFFFPGGGSTEGTQRPFSSHVSVSKQFKWIMSVGSQLLEAGDGSGSTQTSLTHTFPSSIHAIGSLTLQGIGGPEGGGLTFGSGGGGGGGSWIGMRRSTGGAGGVVLVPTVIEGSLLGPP